MQELARQFVPCADEVWRLQNRDGPECELFRVIAEQGHYAGRTEPTNTRQGIYMTAPSGKLLASVNTRSAREMIRVLEHALVQWEQMPDEDRYLPSVQVTSAPLNRRSESAYPLDGLILRLQSRDLPRDETQQNEQRRRRDRNWRAQAANNDYAWFRRSEMRAFVPRVLAVGQSIDVLPKLIERLARLHLVDNVRGQVSAFDARDVKEAKLTSRITRIDGDLITVELRGATRTVHPRTGPAPEAAGDQSSGRRGQYRDPSLDERGVETQLLGTATFDRSKDAFTAFEMIAVGQRWGGTRYNSREYDLDRNGIGFMFTLANDDPPVAPAFLWQYGW